MSNAFVFSKSRFLIVLSVFLLSVFQAKSQEQKFFDFSLAGSVGGIGLYVGDPTRGGLLINLGPEFAFPKLKSAIEFRLGYGNLSKNKEVTDDSNYYYYEVDMLSYGLVYKYLFYFTENGSYFVLENDFSWANLKGNITEGNHTPVMNNYFFYTFRLGWDIKADDLVRIMPWVGLSSLNMKPLLNKPQHPFGGEDFPITFGLTIKIF